MKAVVALLAALLTAPATPLPAPRVPVLVELFTSEGCSSCPPADALLAALLREPPVPDVDVIPLSLHVDYWDHQGWKDPFSSKTFTARQQAYSRIFGEDRVYTPQMVVDGRDEFTGSDAGKARLALAGAASRPHLPLTIAARTQASFVRVSIDLPAAPANSESIDVLVALTEDDLTSIVKRGENGGRTLNHVAVVRSLQTLGTLDRESFVANGQLDLNRAWRPSNMRAVAWLQGQKTRHVYGAATSPLAR
jgi:hypothetical protein